MGNDAPEGARGGKKLGLHWKILIGLTAGALAGLAGNALWPGKLGWFTYNITEPVGQIFLRLVFMVVIPLVFAALVLGVAGIGNVRRLGRMGLRTLGLTVVLSGTSVVIGLALANLVRPGERMSAEKRRMLREQVQGKTHKPIEQARQAKPLRDVLLDIIPKNPVQEMVGALDGSSPGGGMLAVMFFALMVGIAITLNPARTAAFVSALEGLYDVCMTLIGMAMKLAPLGVAALVFSLTAVLGLEILKTLALYVATVVAGLALHTFGTYSLFVTLFGGKTPRAFFRAVSEALVTGFATSSSNATLPTSLRVAEQNLLLKPEVSRFVLTVGATANQNGTALYEGITVLFLAQVFGVELGLGQQVVVLLMAVMAGLGTAGVPGGSLPLVVMVLLTVGIPPEGIGIILGVDRLLDMCRTSVNVTGDLAVASCVDRTESARANASR